MTKRQKILLVAIILLAFLYRLIALDYPLINTEPQRDYLIAQHILTYQDLPKSGPCCLFNGSYAPYRHPVIYYYILSGILAINQNFMFLALINLFLQLIPMITIFVLTYRFFSYKIGLLAILFYSFHQEIYKHALFIWQPHLKQPFLYGSFLILFLFYRTRRYWLLVMSTLLLYIGAAIHLSVMAIVPFWLVALFFILYFQKRSVKMYLTTFLLVGGGGFALIGLMILNQSKGVSLEVFKNPLLLMHTSIIDYGHSLFSNTHIYVSSLYGNGKEISIIGIFLLILSCLFFIWYLLQKKHNEKRLYVIILASVIVVFIAGISFLKATMWHFYLEPLFGISMILFAKTIASQKYRLVKALAVVWILVYMGHFLMYYPPKIKFLINARHIDQATTVLAKAIIDVARQKGYSKPNFFLIQVYTQGVETPTIEDLAFWLPLEQKLQEKFIQVSDTTNSFKRLNSSYYMYIVCQSFAEKINISKDCLNKFNKEFSGYKIDKVIYKKEPFTIYEALLKR